VSGVSVLVDPHAADLAIWPEIGREKGRDCNQQKKQGEKQYVSRISWHGFLGQVNGKRK